MSRVYFEAKIEKLYLCEIITFNKFCATPLKCYMRINKQLIKLVYNDVKNLDKFSSAPMVSRVYFEATIQKLYLCEIITFNKFCATPLKCYMRLNKQLITLVYNDVNHLGFIYNLMQWCNMWIFQKFRKALSQYF